MSGQSFPTTVIEVFVAAVQGACLPGVWSRGAALVRESTLIEDKANDDELIVRILLKGRPVHPRVTLWPTEEDWFCDCGDRNDPCSHIAAAAIALKNGLIQKPALTNKEASTSVLPDNGVAYRLSRKEKTLELERWILASGRESRLAESLVGWIGGIQSGRISHPAVAATQTDFAIDQLLGARSASALDRAGWARLLLLLEDCHSISLNGAPVRTSKTPVTLRAHVIDENGGFRLKRKADAVVTEVFQPGIALCAEVLRPVRDPELSASERELLKGEGTHFHLRDAASWVAEVIPSLQRKIQLDIETSRLPSLIQSVRPRIALDVENDSNDSLSVVADLVYGDPPLARVRLDQSSFEILSGNQIPERDLAEEKRLLRELQDHLHLQPGNRIQLRGDAAVDFLQRTERQALLAPPLTPKLHATESDFDLSFGGSTNRETVFQCWRENRSYVPLLSGGWAPLPKDWLDRYGERVLRLLEARTHAEKKIPSFLLPEIIGICEENSEPYPESLKKLKRSLENFESIPESPLPKDLTVSLRSYQLQGVRWLAFLREHQMGALLADDMGLGKTLQALCAVQGRTLIVCPTSVLSSWSEQIRSFRPSLSQATYHGGSRQLDPEVQITLTTYGILRVDRERLATENWDTIVLDEAHSIKNPQSQIARAAHSLRAPFRIALSGTPIENRLDDLWSQFQFLNPGLLGKRDDFENEFSRGGTDAEERLRKRIRPFLLRRLKKEVAPELPPRTEVTLHCELTAEERDLYDSILAANRGEVLRQLEQGESYFAVLETLLRLRQTCCHPKLVPGQAQSPENSSKTALLLETLQDSIAMGHRSLVFSQWTSYLDLIEPLLAREGIAFLRLDGGTPHRQRIVQDFQNPAGPPVLLLSLKAGGVGLTLTAADHVFLLDPWWNPTVENQAADRAHRIGQTNPVLIHRLVAKDTIEDKVLQLQREKLRLSGAILEDSASAAQMTREDLLEILR